MITIERATATAVFCTSCGTASTCIPSPLASVGLTVYSHALICAGCGRLEFTPTDPDASAISVSSRRTATPCSTCNAPLNELPNPYYGAKRAMEPYIPFCTTCSQS